MSKALAPLKVSPVIKVKCKGNWVLFRKRSYNEYTQDEKLFTARWACFIMGIFFGYTKLQSLRAYEKIARPKREAQIHKEHKDKKIIDLSFTKRELVQAGREFEVTEFPEGWEKEL